LPKKHDDHSASVYRKEGKAVVETNPEIDLAEGRTLASLYLEDEVKTYDFVGEASLSLSLSPFLEPVSIVRRILAKGESQTRRRIPL